MILSGKDLATKLKAEMAEQVKTFPDTYGRVPHLVVILVGDDLASATYVRNKAKASEAVGIKNTTVYLPAETSEQELLAQIDKLNNDDSVDGILVQLPVPKHISELNVISAIAKEKDVDGFHPLNVASLWRRQTKGANVQDFVIPCTPKGVIRMLKAAGVAIDGKKAVVVGRSNIVGLPVAKLLLNENATVTICHSHTKNLASFTRSADILVSAIGKSNFITGDMVSEGAVVIDVGINRNPSGKGICGDVDFASVEGKASVITPVPGGVGPMTICELMSNTIECFLRKQK